jgi:hypothetical protein
MSKDKIMLLLAARNLDQTKGDYCPAVIEWLSRMYYCERGPTLGFSCIDSEFIQQ